MSHVMAIVSKAVFEKQAPGAKVGTVVPYDHYASTHKSLDALAGGGSLFLVTVRPPDEALWLVAVLEAPEKKQDGWHAAKNAVPIRDLGGAKAKLRFANGKGIQAKPGALGMSLQTPRTLTDEDVGLLGGKAVPAAAPAKQAKAAKVAAPKAEKKPAKVAAPKAEKKPAKVAPAKAEPATGALAPLQAAFDAGDGEAALLAALACWREARAPRLAGLIDAISARVSGEAVAGEAAWNQLAATRDPRALGRLLPAVVDLPTRYLPTAAELLKAFPDDPRIAHAVATWALDPPTTSSSTYPFWTRALDTVARTGDTRAIALLRKRLKMTPPKGRDAWHKGPSQFWGKFYAALESTIAKLEKKGGAEDDAAVARLEERVHELAPVAAAVEAVPPPAKADGPPLAQAQTHLAAGRVADAIDALLEAWRATRAPEIADAIDAASRLLPGYDRRLAHTEKDMQAAWSAASSSREALPQLVQNLNAGGAKVAELRLAELATRPDDPRVALRLTELAASHAISPQRTQYWKMLLELIARAKDVRTAAPLVDHFTGFTNTYYDHHRQAKRILGAFAQNPEAAFEGRLPGLSGEHGKQLAKISQQIAALEKKHPERALLASIDPGDLGARAVYADWLAEREHPRGELIVLALKEKKSGLSPAELQRMSELKSIPFLYGPFQDLTDHRIGRFARAVDPLSRELHVGTWASTLSWRAAASYPLLCLVERLVFDDTVIREPFDDDFERLLAAAPALREIERVPILESERRPHALGKRVAPIAERHGFRLQKDRFIRT
jgi:uncharacterized protein (TIGR02996 family)